MALFFLLFMEQNGFSQGWRKLFKPTKKELHSKIDSLQILIQTQEVHYKYKIELIEEKLGRIENELEKISEDKKILEKQLDSMRMSLIVQEDENQEILETLKVDSFCPDSIIVSKVDILSECSCYKNSTSGTKINTDGLNVVLKGIEMVADTKKLVRGSCWKYINTVYNSAEFPSGKRTTIYSARKGSRLKNMDLIQPGDWIYHINHSFHNVEHSAIFICWKDYNKKIGITLSHVGQNKSRTGQFGAYDLKSVYNIIRPENF